MQTRPWSLIIGAMIILGSASATVVAAPKDEEDSPGEDGADVLDLSSCRMRTSPDPGPKDYFFTDDGHVTIGPKGQVTLVCHADLPPGTVEPFTQEGFECRLGSKKNVTFDSKIMWTASGQGTLVCHGTLEE